MYNFTFNIPTKIHFGKDTISSLSELKAYGSKVKNGVKHFHLYSTEKFIKIQQIEVFGRHGAAHGIILICVCDIPRIRRITTPPPQAE